jgi:DNA-directed RNA polymerase subunit beta'
LRIQGREAVQMYLLDEVQKVYRSQGVTIHDKHIEIIIRQMLRRVRVLRSGDTDMLVGELVDRFDFEEANAKVDRGGWRAGAWRTCSAGRDQGFAQYRELPGSGLLPGDDPRVDRRRGARG